MPLTWTFFQESPLNVDTENRDISSDIVLQTEARPDKKSVKFSDDVEDVLKKTCKLATAVPKLKKVTILSIHTITFNLEHPLTCIFYIIIWDTLPHRSKESLVLIMEMS